MKIALIPARGGSKRIPRKNIRPFRGKPMIAWSIAAAQAANCFDRIVVSTDDEEIAAVALRHGAEVPFFRPAALSDDQATTQAVVRHALQWFERQDLTVEAVCCLYATAPFVQAADLAAAAALLTKRLLDVLCLPPLASLSRSSGPSESIRKAAQLCFSRSTSTPAARILKRLIMMRASFTGPGPRLGPPAPICLRMVVL
jgi:CMP-2-keto-3-deoxyoctulosonic acid synthetase